MKINSIKYTSLFIVLIATVMSFGFQTTPVVAMGACTGPGSSISVTTPTGNPPTSFPTSVTITWNTNCVDGVYIYGLVGDYDSAVGTSGSYTKTASGPESYTLWAYTNDCYPDGWCTKYGVAFQKTGVLNDIPPPKATVTVDLGTCPVGTTWSSSNGFSSSPFSFDPGALGTAVSIATITPSGGYISDGALPLSQMTFQGGGPYSFTLACHLPPPAPKPSNVVLSGNPTTLSCALPTATLSWSSTGATSCSAVWTASSGVSGSQAGIGAGTYQITCSNANGDTPSNFVTINPAGGSCATPSVTVTATPSIITSGNSSTISWTSSGATSCPANWWSGAGLSGSVVVTPGSTTNYSKICSNANGDGSDSATVTVTAPSAPSVTINASPTNGTVNVVNPTITWSATNSPTLCSASGDWSGAKASSGSQSMGILSSVKTYTFTLSCTNAGGTDIKSATVIVNDASVVFDFSISALSNNLPITKGDSGQQTISLGLIKGATQPVAISASGMPVGVSVNYSPTSGCSPNCSAFINFNVAPTTLAGTYLINVSGNGGGVSHGTSFNLIVQNASSLSVTCSVAPVPSLIGQPITWTATPSGGISPFTYEWSGTDFVGTPTVNPFTFTYQSTGKKTVTATVTDAGGSKATCAPKVIQVTVNLKIKEF